MLKYLLHRLIFRSEFIIEQTFNLIYVLNNIICTNFWHQWWCYLVLVSAHKFECIQTIEFGYTFHGDSHLFKQKFNAEHKYQIAYFFAHILWVKINMQKTSYPFLSYSLDMVDSFSFHSTIRNILDLFETLFIGFV